MFDWRRILKIKTPNGEYLVVKDVEKFKERLRAELNSMGLSFYGQIGYNRGRTAATHIPSSTEGVAEAQPTEFNEASRKSVVMIREKWEGDRLIIIASARHPTKQDRFEYVITLDENDEGDFIYLTALGPNLNLGGSDELNNEVELITAISDALQSTLETESEQPEVARPIPEPERQTAAEVASEVEESNPGHVMIDGQMHSVVKLMLRAERLGISYNALLERMGRRRRND